jgi:Response regulator containing a CheY-like receiver domain and an HD-GYP domain
MKTILIVDDLSQNLYLLEVLLSTNGYKVEKASNGIQALEIAGKEVPDLVISDILMPGMDGFTLCRAWKSDAQLNKIPFIFYTATYTDPRDEKLALSLGAEKFLVKPVDTEIFLSAIKEIFEKQEIKAPILQAKDEKSDTVFYKEYNETLVRKLEDKMLQLQKSNKRLAALYQVSSNVHVIKSSSQLMKSILTSLIDIAGYPMAVFFTYEIMKNSFHLESSFGLPEMSNNGLEEFVFQVAKKKGWLGTIKYDGKSLNIPDTGQEPDWVPNDLSIRSALYTPVYFEKTLLGIIGVFSDQLNAFTIEDESDLNSLTSNFAIAIDNIESRERVNNQLKRISALHDIDQAINNLRDLNTILNIFLKHVINLLQIDAANILLLPYDEITFEYSTGRGFTTSLIENDLIRLGKSLCKQVAYTRNIVTVRDLNYSDVNSDFRKMWNAEGFALYFGVPLIAKGQVIGILEVFNRTAFQPNSEWIDFLITLAGQAAIAIENTRMFIDLQRWNIDLNIANDDTIQGWARAVDLHNHETDGHTQKVVEITCQMAKLAGIENEQMIHIKRGAFLHDLGKLLIPDAILQKPGPLSDEEWSVMRRHPQIAYDILYPIEYLRPALDIPFSHHERWDGSGYPNGLKGKQIPLSAQLFSVAHVWSSLTSDRPYRKAWSEAEVNNFIREQSGKFFNPQAVDLFFQSINMTK